MPCVAGQNRAQAHLLGIYLSPLSGSLMRFLSVLRLASDLIYQLHLLIRWFIIFNSQSYFAVSFLISNSQFHLWGSFTSDLNFFISFSVSAPRLWDRTWLNTQHKVSSRCRLFYSLLAAYLYLSRTHQQSDLAVYVVYIVYRQSQSGNVRPGLSLRMQLLVGHWFFVSTSQEHSLVRTQQSDAHLSIRHTRIIPIYCSCTGSFESIHFSAARSRSMRVWEYYSSNGQTKHCPQWH